MSLSGPAGLVPGSQFQDRDRDPGGTICALILSEVQGVRPTSLGIREAARTCFFGPRGRQRIVWIRNISLGVTCDRHLGIDLAQKGTGIESSIFSILTDG